ncbi:hypothetical protein TeGR_g11136 [Tetraparma gracilis]|uniref:Complex 1 LYR protein domain-containing protein n=1 Tax=Tetraparma gracilis TaxID=2962635 RepID=A0ABQ6N6X8_9STRA|nr:hypothetical protein TeGR_g11136 [Tetraparma gracilis]
MSAPVTLLRSLLRTSRSLTDFNVKAYARRRTMVGFRQNQSLAPEEAAAAMAEGEKMLGVMKRQAAISQMYPGGANVMENVIMGLGQR